MRFWTMALLNLGRRPMRSLLTVLGIVAAVGSFVAIVGLSRGLENAWLNNLAARGTHLLAIQKGAVEILTTSVDENLSGRIQQIEGVEAVAGELGDMMTLESDHTTVVDGWPIGCFLWKSLRLVTGRLPAPEDRDVVVIGQAAAESLNKKPGDTLLVRDRPYRIVGVFRTTGVMGNNSAILPLAAMQDMMQRTGKVTGFHIRVADADKPGQIAAVQARLRATLPDLSIIETSTAADNDLILKLFRAVAWSVSVIAIIIALVVVLNTLLMSVLERTHEIGVLSAVGWARGRIEGMIVLEGLVLSLVGAAIGLAAGVAGLDWLTSLPRIRGLIEPQVTVRLLLEVFAAAVALGVLGSLYPAWRAARLNIVDALRYE